MVIPYAPSFAHILICYLQRQVRSVGPEQPSMATRNQIREGILEHAVLHGEFTLSSGKSSDYYIDKYQFGTRPQLLDAIAESLAERFQEVFPGADRFAVPALGAVPLAGPLSIHLDLPYVIVRKEQKEHGTGSRLEGTFSRGETVPIVEDIVTTGGEAIRSLEALQAEDLEVPGVLCVVSRQEGGEDNLEERGVPLHSLFTATDLNLK